MIEPTSKQTYISNPNQRVVKKKQGYATSGGSSIIASSGLYIAWSTYLLFFVNKWSFYFVTPGEKLHAVLSWYVAFIVGAAVGVLLIRKMRKTMIYYIAGIIMTISGILLTPSWEAIDLIIVARYIGGIAHGIAFLTVIIHCSEISAPKYRGYALGSISMQIAASLCLGYFFIAVFGYSSLTDFSLDQVYGVLTIVYSVIGLVCTKFVTIESPVYLIQNNDDQEALIALAKLRNDSIHSPNVNQEFQDLKDMINEERDESVWMFGAGNIRPLCRITILRGLYSASTILLLTMYVAIFLINMVYGYGLAVVFLARFIMEAISLFFIDRNGRRLLIVLSSGICGILFIIVGCLLFGVLDYSTISTIGVFFIFYGISLGLGLSPVSLVHMGESFSIQKKPLSILFVVLVEQIVQIFAIVLFWYTPQNPNVLFLLLGILQVAFSVLFFFVIPETKHLTLRQSRDVMKQFFK